MIAIDENVVNNMAEHWANKIIETIGIKKLTTMPYDALNAEIAEIVNKLEDKIEDIVQSKIEENLITPNLEEIWG